MNIKILFSALLLVSLSFNTFAVETYLRENNCLGILRLIGQQTTYITYKDLPESIPASVTNPLAPKNFSPARKKAQQLVRNLISKEVLADNSVAAFERLKPNTLYTFVVTADEMRFATASRSPVSLLNLGSKHGVLANGDGVHFAGEVWLEDGILVINANSGTFQPSTAYLNDMTAFFQKNFGVKEVRFSDFIPSGASLKGYQDQLKAFLRSRVSNVSEGIVNLVAKNNYQGQVVNMALDGGPGKDLSFKVTDHVGSGTLGIVHKLEITQMSEAAKKAYPHLIKNGKVRDDLVVKFPHNVPMLKYWPADNVFNSAILKEKAELDQLKEIVNQFEQNGAAILANGNHLGQPFLIKKFISSKSIQSLAKILTKLSKVQEIALERDIYQMAKAVKDKLGLDLDIKAENVAWDDVNEKFIMYELSIKKTNSFFLTDGFDGYLRYFNQRLMFWTQKRKPVPQDAEKQVLLLFKQRSIAS